MAGSPKLSLSTASLATASRRAARRSVAASERGPRFFLRLGSSAICLEPKMAMGGVSLSSIVGRVALRVRSVAAAAPSGNPPGRSDAAATPVLILSSLLLSTQVHDRGFSVTKVS